MSKYYIVNEVDRPCERLVAVLCKDGYLRYVHGDLAAHPPMLFEPAAATSLEDFGLVFSERRSDSRIALLAVQVDKSKAIYRTGAGGVRR